MGEERRILKAARTTLREAARRIRDNRELLELWRNNDPQILADESQAEYCRILDLVDRTGVLPRRSGSQSQLPTWIRRHGNAEQLTHALHPRAEELAAGALLLTRLTGHNPGPICDAPAAHHRSDGYSGSVSTALVELVKPRRGTRRFMRVALSDLPSWAAAPADEVTLTGHDELHTAFGVYMLLLDITSAARRITGTDRLMVCWGVKGTRGQGFRTGVSASAMVSWNEQAALLADPVPQAGKDGGQEDASQPLLVSLARIRRTHLQREQRPVGHTARTLATEYLARDATAFGEYRALVSEVLESETAKARAIGRIAALTNADVQEARMDPETAARKHGISVETLKRLISGDADTVLAGCSDNVGGPYDPPGQPCTASFLKCLQCPCARALPHHLPVQVLALQALEGRRSQLTPLRWAERFGQPHAQLTDLLGQVPEAAREQAENQATDDDRRLVERLLAQELDYP